MKLPAGKILLPLAILALGALGVAAQLSLRATPEARAPEVLSPLVRVVTARSEPYDFVVRTQGTVVPRSESELVPQLSGEVVWISPSLVSGGFFEAGDPLLRLDDADFRSALEAARAALARTVSEEARARKERERQARLAEQGVTSQARIDDADNRHRITEAMLREARARLGDAERDLARTELRAPYTGRVRSESVDTGQFVNRGSPLAKLYAVDWAEVRLPIPDRELRFLDLPLSTRPSSGDGRDAGEASTQPNVRLRAEFAGQDHEWTGRIVRTEGEIDARSRMVTLVARIEDPYGAEGDRPPLAVGLFVGAEIEGRRMPEAFLLPRSALQGDDRLLVLADGERLEMRTVDVVRLERDRVVIGGGLRSGERVCVTPLPGAIDGMQVRVAEPPADELGPRAADREAGSIAPAAGRRAAR